MGLMDGKERNEKRKKEELMKLRVQMRPVGGVWKIKEGGIEKEVGVEKNKAANLSRKTFGAVKASWTYQERGEKKC